jgi:hypothetical protein
MNPIRKATIGMAVIASTLTGGAIGAALFNGPAAVAQTTSTTAPATATPAAPAAGAPAAGAFHPNEDPTHEAGESAAREAQEDAGQRPTMP